MKNAVVVLVATILMVACGTTPSTTASQGAGEASPRTSKWVCKAPVLLATANYSGEGMAFIQEFGLMAGRLYEVEKVSDDQVTGVTRRDTHFTCTRSK